jgi:sporulation protein YlmC with PRC-barrel domain
MKISALLGSPVHDADGNELGRVHEVRLGEDLRVEALIYGRTGWAASLGLHGKGETVDWADVADAGPDRITLR